MRTGRLGISGGYFFGGKCPGSQKFATQKFSVGGFAVFIPNRPTLQIATNQKRIKSVQPCPCPFLFSPNMVFSGEKTAAASLREGPSHMTQGTTICSDASL